ncbi:MAG: DNA/RNA nuclease SfsA [Ignisphaera sp.]|nr:DNA/RNA nuclease SfsA [Ignisphaera sp.]MCX8168298.1 DNA/RNA nuclease SfsA [Ignisphaera sp.]MDW8085882.1 DNA/RNA nuclease SfsA [Ignisphaera sp.]
MRLCQVEKLVVCKVLGRVSRFSVLVRIGDNKEYAHINNTGRLKNLLAYGKNGFCIPIEGPKLRYRLIAIEDYEYAAVIDTLLQERAFIYAVLTNLIPWLDNVTSFKRNIRIENEVIDYMFNRNREEILVEVKSAILRIDKNLAGYPDAPTARGRKQIELLGNHCAKGGKAYIVFIAGLPYVKGFKLYCEADKEIGNAISNARSMGVKFKSISMFLNPLTEQIVLDNPDLPTHLDC